VQRSRGRSRLRAHESSQGDIFRTLKWISAAACSFYINVQCVQKIKIVNMSALLVDDALKPATPLIAPLVSGVAGLSPSSSSKVDILNI